MFNEKVIEETDIQFLKKVTTDYFGYDFIIIDYFIDFVSYDNRKYSRYSLLINNFINEKEKKKNFNKGILKFKKNSHLLLSRDSYFKDAGELKINLENKPDEQQNLVLNRKNEEKLIEVSANFSHDIWKEINKGFSTFNSEDLNNLLRYLFNN